MAAPPTTMDKIGTFFSMGRVLLAALTQLVTTPIRSGPRPDSLFKDVMYAATRTQLNVMTIAQEKYMNASTEKTYATVARKENFTPDSVVLSDGSTKAHWVGDKKADKVFVYFHGGGYVLPCSPAHMQWFYDLVQTISKEHPISGILLGYGYAPEVQYPRQLERAAELIHHLIEREGKKPSDIIIGGDSAGGNLTLALLSHILHPHPSVPIEIKLSEPFRGAVLISPWVKFASDDASFKTWEQTDILTPSAAKKWSSAFLGSASLDKYNQPILADSSWFSGLESVVREILVWGGGGEVLIDSINKFNKVLQEAHSNVQVVVQPGVAHEDFIIERLFGYTAKAQGTVVIEEWISSKL